MTDSRVESERSSLGLTFAKLPLDLLRRRDLSYGAKCLYGRLGLFAGKNGVCNPSHAVLAREIGCSDRRIRQLLTELRTRGLLLWRRTQKSSFYRLLGGQDQGDANGTKVPIRSEEKVQSDRKKASDKKMYLKRRSSKDVRDYDYLSPNRKKRDSETGRGLLTKYPSLRKHLREHLKETDPSQPSTNKVIRIIQAADHASEAEIIEALRDIEERGSMIFGIRQSPRWRRRVYRMLR